MLGLGLGRFRSSRGEREMRRWDLPFRGMPESGTIYTHCTGVAATNNKKKQIPKESSP